LRAPHFESSNFPIWLDPCRQFERRVWLAIGVLSSTPNGALRQASRGYG